MVSKRLFRAAEVPRLLLQTAKQGDSVHVQRIVFLPEEGTRGHRCWTRANAPQSRHSPHSQRRPAAGSCHRATCHPCSSASTAYRPATRRRRADGGTWQSGNVFDEIKSNAAARRLLSQMMHPNEQVRERAFEGWIRLVQ